MKGIAFFALTMVLVVGIGFAGAAQEASVDALIPGVLSLGFPGLGHFFIDEVDTGILHMGIVIGLWVGNSLVPRPINQFFWIAPLVWHLYSGYDAYATARDRNFRFGFVENGITVSYGF